MLLDLFSKDFKRAIETVIKADDLNNTWQEVDEYVITNEISRYLGDLFEQYTNYEGANGVWISGFFGSGKSHLLKILSHVLENQTINGESLLENFAAKVKEDPKLKADIEKCGRIPAESILFNIDQKAQTNPDNETNTILNVFYKVFYEHQGYYGSVPHVAEFEEWLDREGKYEHFKSKFNDAFTKPWVDARRDYINPLLEDTLSEVLADIYGANPEKFDGILDKFEERSRHSIENFAESINTYIESKPEGFRLNFFVDEVGQFVAEEVKLMLNLQTIAESLATKCKGKAWIFVTSQEDLESLVGDETKAQSDDFSKIQGRFKIRIPLTSANVDEVIEKRLLAKSNYGVDTLKKVWPKEKDNLKTLLSFSDAGVQFKHYGSEDEFVSKYPFIPYQFDLFQQCIKTLSRHNAFQGKHASVGERSMLGVFQDVLKKLDDFDSRSLISYDMLFEGLRSTLRSSLQSSVILAERQLEGQELAIKALKALFLVKYFDSFKTDLRNISVLLLKSLDTNPVAFQKEVEEALSVLEHQNYIQRNGDFYEFLTDEEKDIQEEIKNTEIDPSEVTHLINQILFDGVIKDNKLPYHENKQYYEYTRKVDGDLFGREKELTIEIVTPNSPNYDNDQYCKGLTMGHNTLMMFRLPPNNRLVRELRLVIQTDKYIRQNNTTANTETVRRVLYDKGQQNQQRKRMLQHMLDEMLAQSTVFLNGNAHRVSTTTDGKTKVLNAFQDLIKLAYSKLSLLGSQVYDERKLALIFKSNQDDLFKGEDATMNKPEEEVLLFIQRRKQANERVSLTDAKEYFGRKPYGWPEFGVWCMLGLLFRRGKIEVRQDSNILEQRAFYDAISNNRLLANTLLYPQVEFDQAQISRLKRVHQELFHESNTASEAKDAAELFISKAAEELERVRELHYQKNTYPFLKNLKEFEELLTMISKMHYANLIQKLTEFEDQLLDLKEDTYDAILQFWNSEQKNIYDRLLEFKTYNRVNIDYLESDESDIIERVMADEIPYRGNNLRDAKQAMDQVEQKVREQLKELRSSFTDKTEQYIVSLKERPEFENLSELKQERILKPFSDLLDKISRENMIANLKLLEQTIPQLGTQQLNLLMELSAPEDQPAPKAQFVNRSNIHVSFAKRELQTETDVLEYVEATKEALLKQIEKNRKILL